MPAMQVLKRRLRIVILPLQRRLILLIQTGLVGKILTLVVMAMLEMETMEIEAKVTSSQDNQNRLSAQQVAR